MIIRLLHPHPTRQRLIFMYNEEMTERVPTKKYEFWVEAEVDNMEDTIQCSVWINESEVGKFLSGKYNKGETNV